MKEYIEKADAINLLWLFADESCASVVSDFEGLPAADVAEVRHAFWSDYGSGVCCTNCGVSLFHQDENNNWGIEPSKFMFCRLRHIILHHLEPHQAGGFVGIFF